MTKPICLFFEFYTDFKFQHKLSPLIFLSYSCYLFPIAQSGESQMVIDLVKFIPVYLLLLLVIILMVTYFYKLYKFTTVAIIYFQSCTTFTVHVPDSCWLVSCGFSSLQSRFQPVSSGHLIFCLPCGRNELRLLCIFYRITLVPWCQKWREHGAMLFIIFFKMALKSQCLCRVLTTFWLGIIKSISWLDLFIVDHASELTHVTHYGRTFVTCQADMSTSADYFSFSLSRLPQLYKYFSWTFFIKEI